MGTQEKEQSDSAEASVGHGGAWGEFQDATGPLGVQRLMGTPLQGAGGTEPASPIPCPSHTGPAGADRAPGGPQQLRPLPPHLGWLHSFPAACSGSAPQGSGGPERGAA